MRDGLGCASLLALQVFRRKAEEERVAKERKAIKESKKANQHVIAGRLLQDEDEFQRRLTKKQARQRPAKPHTLPWHAAAPTRSETIIRNCALQGFASPAAMRIRCSHSIAWIKGFKTNPPQCYCAPKPFLAMAPQSQTPACIVSEHLATQPQ